MSRVLKVIVCVALGMGFLGPVVPAGAAPPVGQVAVGSYVLSSGVYQPLAESSGPNGWAIQSLPVPVGSGGAGSGDVLSSVSCVGSTVCTAVGTSLASSGITSSPLVETYDGSSWGAQTLPNIDAQLSGVSCASATFCVAVGLSAPAPVAPFAATFNGQSWTVQRLPLPSHVSHVVGGALGAVFCSTPTSCVAVGLYQTSAGNSPLAEVFNGKKWTAEAVPAPPGGSMVNSNTTDARLNGISCPQSGACTAVGSYHDYAAGLDKPLIDALSGSGWTLQQVPLPNGFNGGGLEAVSCPSTSNCEVVGGGLAAEVDGTALTWQSLPTPAGSTGVTLLGVACVSAGSCTGVGQSSTSSPTNTLPLAEGLTSGMWSVQPTPAPPGGVQMTLNGVGG